MYYCLVMFYSTFLSFFFFFLMIRRPPRSTLSSSSAASDVYKRQVVTEYGPTKCKVTELRDCGQRRQWLRCGPSAERSVNCWVHVQGDTDPDSSLQTLRLLGMKFSLHPLALEDSFKLSRQRPKCLAFDEHLLVLFPLVVISSSENSTRTTILSTSLVSIFVMTSLGTLISYAEAEGPDEAAPFDEVSRQLGFKYALPRSGDSSLLLYELLDSLISNLGPAADALERAFEECLQTIRMSNAANSPTHQVPRLHEGTLLD
eukprot:TRINITY_DN29519_c0_g1_i2.p1 TRINITY_DN29519_c0_g1~~TRINITY_DN29519_c0_g1_i2.p1  ORF type:complete len:259 (-),score=33.24 TRINITY_DN29519_c0_g1_i2:438-1214(-)